MQVADARAANTPNLALVLGSGGVRSIAGLGVSEALRQAGMQPDLIVGCSSGALFGACIATGMTGEQGLTAAMRLWSAELTQQKRWRAYFELIAPRLMGFNDGFAMRRAGLIHARVERAFGAARLEELPIPLRVIATLAATGESHTFIHGPLVAAVRASMALPLIFPSVEIEGKRFSDGVISDPLPVAAARDAAAIVTLGFRGAMPRRIDRASRLVAQVTTAMINNLQQARIDAARAAGQRMLHLELDVDRRIGLWDTAAMPRLYEIGFRAAMDQLPAIRRLRHPAESSSPTTTFAAAGNQ